jgi:anti-sigma factor RsiW
MTHPTQEQWMTYLYGELDKRSRAALADHLDSCSDCERRVLAWRGVMAQLDGWKLPDNRPARWPVRSFVKCGVAKRPGGVGGARRRGALARRARDG